MKSFGTQFDSKRLAIVLVLLAGLMLGLYFLAPMIQKEFPRLDWWHSVLIWTGDFVAVIFAFRWAQLRPSEGRYDATLSSSIRRLEPFQASARPKSARWAAASLIVALVADIGLTSHVIWTDTRLIKERSR